MHRAPIEQCLRRPRVVHELTEDRRPEFARLGYNQRSPFFAHTIRFVPKSGPDGLKLAIRMAGVTDPARLWLIVVHACDGARASFPAELFFDRDLVWHGQTLGLPGHVAYACVLEDRQEVVGLNYISDLVQRIGRRRAYKTQVEKHFRGWPALLLNALGEFARLRGLAGVRSPTADLVMRHTDRKRSVRPELFERVYDRSVAARFRARRDGDWWSIPLADNADRLVRPIRRVEPGVGALPVVVFHDLTAQSEWLQTALAIEAKAGARTTYDIPGRLLEALRRPIERDGHALAFHGFDHNPLRRQLHRCRRVDGRIKGYRRPWSLATPAVRGRNLSWFNFEWVAARARALARVGYTPADRLVRIPLATDDDRVAAPSGAPAFRALVLRDRSAARWLPHYAALLSRLADEGPFWTADDLANHLFLAEAA